MKDKDITTLQAELAAAEQALKALESKKANADLDMFKAHRKSVVDASDKVAWLKALVAEARLEKDEQARARKMTELDALCAELDRAKVRGILRPIAERMADGFAAASKALGEMDAAVRDLTATHIRVVHLQSELGLHRLSQSDDTQPYARQAEGLANCLRLLRAPTLTITSGLSSELSAWTTMDAFNALQRLGHSCNGIGSKDDLRAAIGDTTEAPIQPAQRARA